MRIIGIIPARYESSRLPGKPLSDIMGKPMIWWVYNQAKKVQLLDEVVVAVDHDKVMNKCTELGINAVMTNSNHPSHVHRIHEVSNMIFSDFYVCICGDEPLIEPEVIEKIVPLKKVDENEIYVGGMRRVLKNPVETIDSGNIKIIVDKDEYGLALSRTPIPYPYKTLQFDYYKTIGIECFNKNALNFYVNSEKGEWEKAEDIMMLRFIENHIKVKFTNVESESLSVDTVKDLEKVRNIMIERNYING